MIISTTLIGPGTAHLAADALASVADAVDAHLIINTSGEKLPPFVLPHEAIAFDWPWPNDFGAARNLALDAATFAGAEWAVTLDTDERLHNATALRRAIATTEAPALSVAYQDGSYAKPRAIRLPCTARWHGKTHEAIAIEAPTTDGVAFSELPKSPEQLQAKRIRDLPLLQAMAIAEPTDGRWLYYLGDTFEGLGNPVAAIAAWERCAEVSTWDEEAAWACYRAANALLFSPIQDAAHALVACTTGLARHPGVAELPWLAAIACQRLGRHEHALHWAALARVHGERSAAPLRALDHRRGFRAVKGLRHGPADVERFSLRALGMDDAAAAAEMEFALMEAAR